LDQDAGELTRDREPARADAAAMRDIERQNQVLLSLPRKMVGIAIRHGWGWISILPTAPGECLVYGGSISEQTDAETREMMAGSTDAYLKEDQDICERNQRAMRAKCTKGGQLVELERVCVDFQQYLGWKLFEQEPDKLHSAPEASNW
jgi:hypothetical protein